MKHYVTLTLEEAKKIIKDYYKVQNLNVEKVVIEINNKDTLYKSEELKEKFTAKPSNNKKTTVDKCRATSFEIDIQTIKEELTNRDTNYELTPTHSSNRGSTNKRIPGTGKLVNTAGVWNIEVGNDKIGKKHIPVDYDSYKKIEDEGIKGRPDNVYVNFEYYPKDTERLATIKKINRYDK